VSDKFRLSEEVFPSKENKMFSIGNRRGDNIKYRSIPSIKTAERSAMKDCGDDSTSLKKKQNAVFPLA